MTTNRDLEALADAVAKMLADERRERRKIVDELTAEVAALRAELETTRTLRVVGGKAA